MSPVRDLAVWAISAFLLLDQVSWHPRIGELWMQKLNLKSHLVRTQS